MHRGRGKLVAVVVASTVLIPVALVASGIVAPAEAGVHLVFDVKTVRDGRVQGVPGFGREVFLSVLVLAVAPPEYGEDLVPVFLGAYSGGRIIIPASGKLGEVAKAWAEHHRKLGNSFEDFVTGLIVFASALNATALSRGEYDKAKLFSYAESISYSPSEILAGRAVEYRISITAENRTGRTVNIEKSQLTISVQVPGLVKVYAQPPTGEEQFWCYSLPIIPIVPPSAPPLICYSRKLFIAPENLTEILGSDYFTDCGGKLCMKTPITVLYNYHINSGVVTASVDINPQQRSVTVGIRPSFSTGPLTKVLMGQDVAARLTFSMGVGYTWGGSSVYFGASCSASPENWCWIWIWARPIFAVYDEYYVYIASVYISDYLGEYSVASITTVLTSNNKIVGGIFNDNKPPDPLINFIFGNDDATQEVNVTRLWPGDSISFRDIVKTFDTCGVGLTITLPIGDIVAAILVVKAPVLGFVAPIVKTVLPVFTATYAPASIEITGHITNYGQFAGVGSNIFEDVYIRVSKLQYVQGSCRYNVPVAMYFRSR